METRPMALFLFIYLYILTPNPVTAQISTVSGIALFSGTPVLENPHGVPTLVYNCAKLPAICTNVNRAYPLSPHVSGGYGSLIGVSHVVLHFDTDEARKDARRKAACPNSWKITHPCPETVPPQPETVPANSRLGAGSFPAARYNPKNLPPGASGYNTIANPQGQHSGMIWTCDEFPPATSIEGGGGANSYCAPQSAACAGQGVISVRSEQDFQSSAHSALRNYLYSNPRSGVFSYHFKTAWYDSIDEAATEVHWYDDSGDFVSTYQRSITDPRRRTHLVVDRFFSNGTQSQSRHPLLPETAPIRPRHVVDPNGSSVHQGFETLLEPPLLPFIEIAREFIADQAEIETRRYIDLAVGAPRAEEGQTLSSIGNETGTANFEPSHDFVLRTLSESPLSLVARQDQGGKCSRGSPCPDGSCCNMKGECGYGEKVCGDDVCISNCNATALCGRDSLGGTVHCPLNVCCSYYGYCGVEQDFCIGTGSNAPCQAGFGSCEVIRPPSCGSGSANGRSIGYWQVANVRERQCNRISPAQINIQGLTHLYLAFASIDPTSFKVVPGHSDDIKLYREFTALKSGSLQTWVAIGGWSFNDPGSTRNTFSNLARTSQSRATFIASLASFLEEYGFQGVDIDWEYPGAPDRGGIIEDTDNYISLVKELRERLGTRFGISIAIPTSYWYLRWFKPKQMEPYVDWFGVMTYDLHGPWDEAVRQIGRVILGHTNIPEIANWTLPLYYDGVSPAKLNMGLAYYARGYTATDANCNTIGCNWTGESRPAACTNFAGVMSLQEVERLMEEEGIQSRLLPREVMKELTFGDQWIGYDDLETIRMKKEWASRRCFGGTMIWSVDMYSGPGSGDMPDGNGSTSPSDPGSGMGEGSGQIFIDPSIWDESSPEIRCQPPCTFILPPTRLPTETTISFPPYTTSLDVAWSESGTWTSIIQTTVLTIPPVVTTEIEVWGYTVRDTRTVTSLYSTHYITPSIRPPRFTIVNDPNPLSKSGVSHPPVTRTITPPPYPYTFTPEGGHGTKTSSSSTNVLPIFPIVTWKPGPPGPICRSNCGRPCRLFCNSPCLLSCHDGGADFADPDNPKPPGRPTPKPTRDPHPPGTPTKPPVPPDPQGTKPQNEEQEEDDQNCALELGQPLPTYRPPPMISIVKPPAPPLPSPEPPKDPPGPNRDTEQVNCYNSGQRISRALCIEALEYFCDDYEGVVLDATRPGTRRTLSNDGYGVQCIGKHGSIGGCFVLVQISVTVKNGCRFTVGGKGPRAECGRIIRRIIDECDTSSTEWKQGGTLESNCASWRFDPNTNW